MICSSRAVFVHWAFCTVCHTNISESSCCTIWKGWMFNCVTNRYHFAVLFITNKLWKQCNSNDWMWTDSSQRWSSMVSLDPKKYWCSLAGTVCSIINGNRSIWTVWTVTRSSRAVCVHRTLFTVCKIRIPVSSCCTFWKSWIFDSCKKERIKKGIARNCAERCRLGLIFYFL